jgi:outer membrane protein TolC
MNRSTAWNRCRDGAAAAAALLLAATTTFAQVQPPSPGLQVAAPPIPPALSLLDAIERGLAYNLDVVTVTQGVKEAGGRRAIARSALLPSVFAEMRAMVQKMNLAAMGLGSGFIFPGFRPPTVVGPFNTVDLRLRASQTVFDLTSWNTYHASTDAARAAELSAEDARDLVVVAVAGTYLEVVAAGARVESARAQLETATLLFRQNAERRAAGLLAQVDVDRSEIQALAQQQRLTSLQNDFAKQKIALARLIGSRPTELYDLVDTVPFTAAPPLGLEDALQQARAGRADLKAAEARLDAARRTLAAARAERVPSVSVDADYGALGTALSNARSTFSIAGNVRVPLWNAALGGQVDQAEADEARRRAELDDVANRVESEIRTAHLDLEAATNQVDVARRNLQVSSESLDLTRQRFDAGITSNIEVVQAQESVAAAELDYINSVYAHNLGKLHMARAIGQVAERWRAFLGVP